MKRKYERLNSKKVFDGWQFSIDQDEIMLPTGKVTSRDVVRHRGAVVILPKNLDGTLVLVDQYRYAIGRDLLEFPAGTLELGEPPIECAKREIKEEIKFAATQWTELGSFYPAPGFCDEIQHFFFAENLYPDAEVGDEDEIIDVVCLSISEVEKAISEGRLQDSKSIAIFYQARSRGLI